MPRVIAEEREKSKSLLQSQFTLSLAKQQEDNANRQHAYKADKVYTLQLLLN